MSHHSANAWQNYISREFPNELDTIRKRVGIARRKATHTNDSLHSNSSINAEVGPSKPRLDLAMVEAMAVDKPSLTDNDWKLDFQDICTFFANSSAHEESDDATVWASLEAEVSSTTKHSNLPDRSSDKMSNRTFLAGILYWSREGDCRGD